MRVGGITWHLAYDCVKPYIAAHKPRKEGSSFSRIVECGGQMHLKDHLNENDHAIISGVYILPSGMSSSSLDLGYTLNFMDRI